MLTELITQSIKKDMTTNACDFLLQRKGLKSEIKVVKRSERPKREINNAANDSIYKFQVYLSISNSRSQ